MNNLFAEFNTIFTDQPVFIGKVTIIGIDTVTVDLVSSGEVVTVTNPDNHAININNQVYIQGGKITGIAPSLPVTDIFI